MTRAIRALIFDMDGLLVDSEPLAAKAMAEFLAQYGHTPRAEVAAKLLGRRLPDAVAIVREAYGLSEPIDVLARQYSAMRLAALRGNLRPMPGAVEVISFAREAGLRMALATSSAREQANVALAEAGLAGCFDTEVTGDEVERGKPAPDLFLTAASRLDVPPEACAVLEDSPLGIEAALEAGMRAIAVPNERTAALPFPPGCAAMLPDLHAAIAWLTEQGVSANGHRTD